MMYLSIRKNEELIQLIILIIPECIFLLGKK
jgi:hypothetical protein